jgi:hypothetical protein
MVMLSFLDRPKMSGIATSSVMGALQTRLAGLKPDDRLWLFLVEAPHRPAAGDSTTGVLRPWLAGLKPGDIGW